MNPAEKRNGRGESPPSLPIVAVEMIQKGAVGFHSVKSPPPIPANIRNFSSAARLQARREGHEMTICQNDSLPGGRLQGRNRPPHERKEEGCPFPALNHLAPTPSYYLKE